MTHIALSWNTTALLLRQNANEAESSAILHQKTLSILFQNLLFFKKVESDIGENLGRPRSDEYQSTN